MERNEKTRALLAAFGCARAYLLAGKALTAVLPQVPEEAARMWAFVHRCAAAPIVEEWVFRGIIQQLARPLGERQAVALQHRGPAGMAYALVCGLVLGTLRSRTGSVWPGMLLHTLNNLLVFAAG